MGQIQVDTRALDAAAGQIRASLGVAREFSQRHGWLSAGAEACGNAALANALAGFLGGWGREMHKLAGNADTLASLLESMAGIYDRIEDTVRAGPG